MLFDDPEFKMLVEQDKQMLAHGKADVQSRMHCLNENIDYYQSRLQPDVIEQYCSQDPDKIDEYKDSCEKQISRAKEELALLSDVEHINRVEALAHDILSWERYEPTKEERERDDKIIHDNLVLSNSEILSKIAPFDDAVKDIIDAAANLTYKDPMPEQYSWNNVALSMLRFPEKVKFDYDRCPRCGHSRLRIHFHSPRWTWAMMCGVAGDMVICPECKIQAAFHVTMRN